MTDENTPTAAGMRQPDASEPIDPDKQLQLVSFEVGEEEFAIEILAVQEIIRMMPITGVPHSTAAVEGVINLRGQVTPVVDLRKRFGLDQREEGQDSRIVVVEVGGHVLGFIVDRVNEVLRVNSNIVEPTPALTTGIDSDYVRGVGKMEDRLLILLDLDRLFSSSDLEAAEQVKNTAA